MYIKAYSRKRPHAALFSRHTKFTYKRWIEHETQKKTTTKRLSLNIGVAKGIFWLLFSLEIWLVFSRLYYEFSSMWRWRFAISRKMNTSSSFSIICVCVCNGFQLSCAQKCFSAQSKQFHFKHSFSRTQFARSIHTKIMCVLRGTHDNQICRKYVNSCEILFNLHIF